MVSWSASRVIQPGVRVDARRPAGWCSHGLEAEVGGLDAQRGVVRHHAGRRVHRLAERGADDAVVGHVGVEPVLDEQVLLHAVDLDLQRALRGRVADGERCGQRAAGAHAVLLDGAQRGACRAADVVGAGLQAVELLDHRERDDDVAAGEAVEATGIADEHRRVEHHSRTHTSLQRIVNRHGWARDRSTPLQSWVDGGGVPERCQL